MNKKLVAYFSATGITKEVAKRLAKIANADLFEIKPKILYTNADLDWTDAKSRSSIEMKNPKSRPEIAEMITNMNKYNIVFLGFPIWWYVAPTIINTFLESYDFSGKTIVPFATSGGSGLGNTLKNLQQSCSPTAIWHKGEILNNVSDDRLSYFVKNF